jgi:hypothetical protein
MTLVWQPVMRRRRMRGRLELDRWLRWLVQRPIQPPEPSSGQL